MNVLYTPKALSQLEELSRSDRSRILKKIDFFASQPDPFVFAKHLTGYDVYRFRIGNFRVLCEDRSDVLIVALVAKRDGIYRDL